MKTLKQEIQKIELPTFSLGQTLILMLLVSFATVGALAVSPALPAITRNFDITKHASQLMITIYMVGFALGSLIYAPLANRHGRKPVMIACLAVSALASFVGVLSAHLDHFLILILSRLFMALAASGCLKISFNIAADVLKGHHLTRMTSLFTASFAIAPPLSIALGGWLTENMGWESICLFLALYAILLIFLTLFIPETLKEKVMHAMHRKHIIKTYSETLKGQFMITGPLMIGCTISALYLFGAEAPFISENIIGLTPSEFGFMSMITYLGLLIGGLLVAALSKHLKTSTFLFTGLFFFFASSLVLLFLFANNLINTWTLFLPSAFIFFGMSLVFSSGISITLSHAKDKSYGSSLMNFINLGFSTLVVLLLGHIALIHVIAYPILLVTLAILATILSVIIKLKKRDL